MRYDAPRMRSSQRATSSSKADPSPARHASTSSSSLRPMRPATYSDARTSQKAASAKGKDTNTFPATSNRGVLEGAKPPRLKEGGSSPGRFVPFEGGS